MTTKDFILKVKELCEGKLEVTSIGFQHKFNCVENRELLWYSVHYHKNNERIAMTSFSKNGNSLESLLIEFEADLIKEIAPVNNTEVEFEAING